MKFKKETKTNHSILRIAGKRRFYATVVFSIWCLFLVCLSIWVKSSDLLKVVVFVGMLPAIFVMKSSDTVDESRKLQIVPDRWWGIFALIFAITWFGILILCFKQRLEELFILPLFVSGFVFAASISNTFLPTEARQKANLPEDSLWSPLNRFFYRHFQNCAIILLDPFARSHYNQWHIQIAPNGLLTFLGITFGYMYFQNIPASNKQHFLPGLYFVAWTLVLIGIFVLKFVVRGFTFYGLLLTFILLEIMTYRAMPSDKFTDEII